MFKIVPSQTREYLFKKYTKYNRKYVLCSKSSRPKHGSIYSKNILNITGGMYHVLHRPLPNAGVSTRTKNIY